MKHTMSFRLSDKAQNILEKKARVWNLSKTAVLECFIQEFSPSTKEEKFQQKENHRKALRAFLDSLSPSDDPKTCIEKAWRNGFSNGWMQFQIRKSSSLFKLEK